jgi:hypothetical protein
MLIYQFDMDKEDFYNHDLCDDISRDFEDQILIRTIALDILRNWNSYRKSGHDIMSEFLFSIDELSDFFYIRIDKYDEFRELLIKAHKFFQKKKDKYGYANISYKICGTIYFCVPNLLIQWPLVEQIILQSVYYTQER